jgi:bifunctional non-homologous end joining protein LigD
MNATMTMPETERITLYYRQGSSDKEYQASIESKGELFVVNFAYGRRGTTLQTGTKTNEPVDFDTAKAIYDKLVREKTAKGYTPGMNGTPYQHADQEERVTAILSQLLNPIEAGQLDRLIKDKDYCAQEKLDGRRIMVRKSGPEIHGINRKGLLVGLPEPIFQAVRMMPGNFAIDGECIGDSLHAFDLLENSQGDQRHRGYAGRYMRLMDLISAARQYQIYTVKTAFSQNDKEQLLYDLRKQKKEGIVFKRIDAPYVPGRPNSGGSQLKHKFYATCSAVVSRINEQRSVELRLLDGNGWNVCGNVTIPPNFEIPPVGQCVEVRYLYAFKESNNLYQPVYLGRRNDVNPHECVLSQIKYKGVGEEG